MIRQRAPRPAILAGIGAPEYARATAHARRMPVKLDEFARIAWRQHPENPLIGPPRLTPLIADPAVVLPEEAPDGLWHLFAHSVLGILHYTSPDGVRFARRPGVACRGALRPNVVKQDGTFTLLYERVPMLRLLLMWLPGLRWRSRIAARQSTDLERFSEERTLLEPSLPWHSQPGAGDAVSNPCLVRLGEGGAPYRLYYSASLVRVPDCGFNEPRHIGVAHAPGLLGPYRPEPEPTISPSEADPLVNLGAGAIKVLRLEDGFVGLQNGIYWDEQARRSGSAILLLGSEDGLSWRRLKQEPVLAPGGGGWMDSHVYALDIKRLPDGSWRLYFNGRNAAHWTRGVERIGLLEGTAEG